MLSTLDTLQPTHSIARGGSEFVKHCRVWSGVQWGADCISAPQVGLSGPDSLVSPLSHFNQVTRIQSSELMRFTISCQCEVRSPVASPVGYYVLVICFYEQTN